MLSGLLAQQIEGHKRDDGLFSKTPKSRSKKQPTRKDGENKQQQRVGWRADFANAIDNSIENTHVQAKVLGLTKTPEHSQGVWNHKLVEAEANEIEQRFAQSSQSMALKIAGRTEQRWIVNPHAQRRRDRHWEASVAFLPGSACELRPLDSLTWVPVLVRLVGTRLRFDANFSDWSPDATRAAIALRGVGALIVDTKLRPLISGGGGGRHALGEDQAQGINFEDFLSETFGKSLKSSDAFAVDNARLQAALGQLVEVTLPTLAEDSEN